MRTIIFDIETGPLPAGDLAKVMPEFQAPKNLKDPAKIAAAIAEKRADWEEGAALSAITGQVLAIGTMETGGKPDLLTGDEVALLGAFWSAWNDTAKEGARFVGFNSNSFDLPFLIRRSWKHRLHVPGDIREQGRYWNRRFIDLRDSWQIGDRQASGSLDAIARHLGLGGKSGDGAHFHQLLATDPDAALAYLELDLILTCQVHDILHPEFADF